MLFSLSPSINDWIALIAFNVTVVGLSSLAEKRTVIGIEYGRYLLDKYKLLGVFRVYHILVAVALVNAAALVVMLGWIDCQIVTTVVFLLLILSSWFVLFYLFGYVLRVHPRVKRSIYRQQLLGLYYKSDTKCDFEGDVVIGMPNGDRTSKKITSDVQHFFNRFDEETISAFREVFGPSSVIYARDRRTMREWERLGYEPHDYRVHKRDKDKTPTKLLHISWEFFQMFRFSEIQDRWLLEILNLFNGSYSDDYPRLRLYNVAVAFGQINRVGFAQGLYRYKFLDYMMPFIVKALDPSGDENREERVRVERYFHTQLGKYIHDTMRAHPAETFTQSARKVLGAMISVEKFRGVVPVRERIPCYQNEDYLEEYNALLNEVISAWEEESVQVKNLVFDFGNVVIGWNPDNLYGKKGEACFRFPSRYKCFRKRVLTSQWLRELDSEVRMHEIVEKRCKEYPFFKGALRMYEREWMKTLSGEVTGMKSLIQELQGDIRYYGLSNWCAETFAKAKEKYDIFQLFDSNYLISGGLEDDGRRIPSKPDPLIFDYFLKWFHLNAGDCLLIDDTYDNVKAARQLGMKALWFTDSETLRLAIDPVVHKRLKWGENRAVWMAPDLQRGLISSEVVVAGFHKCPFVFGEDENRVDKQALDKLKKDFVRYEHSDFVSKTKSLPKCMLLQYDSDERSLRLKVGKTDWHYCQFVWHHRYDGNQNAESCQKEWVNRMVFEHLSGVSDQIQYPNSLCLHLVIETFDEKVLMTTISPNKGNDYPKTKAFTIGEQLEQEDLNDGADFVKTWVRRALNEEFGVSEEALDNLFDISSLRVLSLCLEGDIFNFALVCTIKTRQKLDKFRRGICIDKSEISSLSEITLDAIPGILNGYPYNQNEYHPSSYMRLLSFYLYKKGLEEARKQLAI